MKLQLQIGDWNNSGALHWYEVLLPFVPVDLIKLSGH